MVLFLSPQFQDEICYISRVKQAVNLQPVLGCSDVTEFTTNYYSLLLQMLWLEDVCARRAECWTCTSLRKYKQNPTNRSGATFTWLPVDAGLHKHSLARHSRHLFVCPSYVCRFVNEVAFVSFPEV